jgi:hypothetical protein
MAMSKILQLDDHRQSPGPDFSRLDEYEQHIFDTTDLKNLDALTFEETVCFIRILQKIPEFKLSDF